MARFVQHFTTPYSPQQVMDFVSSYMLKEGFTNKTVNGESCWQKGMGIMTGPQFLRVYQTNNGYVIEAWIKFAVLPGVYAGEMGITGAAGAIPKSLLKSRVEAILNGLQAQRTVANINQPHSYPNQAPAGYNTQPQSYPNQAPAGYNTQPQGYPNQMYGPQGGQKY